MALPSKYVKVRPQPQQQVGLTPQESNLAARLVEAATTAARRGTNLAIAVGKNALAGGPERDPEEIVRIFEQHCTPCTDTDGTPNLVNGVCKKCECNCSGDPQRLLNKIRFATEHCPLGKW